MAARRWSALLLFCVVACASTAEVSDVENASVAESAAGTIGCHWWRIRSIANAVGEYWQIKELEFFESKDGSGNPISKENIEKAQSSTYKDSPKPGQPDTSEHQAIKAVDGDTETFWSASGDLKFEFVSVKFSTPKDIRSIKCQLSSAMMGPPMVIIEKSFDGENWARSTEIADMLNWGTTMQMYPLVNMDTLPTVSTFAFRSQVNPRFCIGVRETPAEDPEDPALPLEEGAVLEIQLCSDSRTTQYWQLRKDFLLGSAKDDSMVVHASALQDQASLSMKAYKCDEAENGDPLCPSWGASSKFSFAEEAKGGIMHSRSDNNANLMVMPDALEEGALVKFGLCGADGTQASDITSCSASTNGQFELKPMFLVEPRKMAIGCAPYTHSRLEPSPAEDEIAAMTLCAKQGNCLAYNWASADAVCPTEPPCEGKYQLHAWACSALHEVHSAQEGWSLGVRAGKLEPFVEELAHRRNKEL